MVITQPCEVGIIPMSQVGKTGSGSDLSKPTWLQGHRTRFQMQLLLASGFFFLLIPLTAFLPTTGPLSSLSKRRCFPIKKLLKRFCTFQQPRHLRFYHEGRGQTWGDHSQPRDAESTIVWGQQHLGNCSGLEGTCPQGNR